MGGSLLWAGVSPQNGRWVPWGDGQGEKQPSEVALTSPGVHGKTRPLCPCSTFFPSFLLRRAQLCAVPCSSSVGLGHFVLKCSPVIILAPFSLNTALEEEGAQHLSPAASWTCRASAHPEASVQLWCQEAAPITMPLHTLLLNSRWDHPEGKSTLARVRLSLQCVLSGSVTGTQMDWHWSDPFQGPIWPGLM